jgi:geranylgeranyl diphosphate synthase, type I
MTVVVPETMYRYQQLIEPALRAAIDRLAPRPRLIAGYHRGWWEADGRPSNGRAGKALRPVLAVLSIEASGGPAELAVPGAVAVELVHDFSLLHDDVMDGDTERRHRPTAWAVFGIPQALLAGDALLALAVQVLAEAEAPGRDAALAALTDAVQRLVDGQFADIEMERRTDVEIADCLAMEANKTSALLACAASIGARLRAAPAELVAALHEYGLQLGLAFQLVDDLLGIWGAPAVTGKPVLADLRAGKRSAPVVAALRSDTPAGRELVDLFAEGAPDTEDDVARAADLVEASGAREWCLAEAESRLAAATAALNAADVPASARAELIELARYVTARDR